MRLVACPLRSKAYQLNAPDQTLLDAPQDKTSLFDNEPALKERPPAPEAKERVVARL